MARLALVLSVSLFAHFLNAQDNLGSSNDTIQFANVHFYVNGTVAVPSREFREVINNSFGNLGYGFNIGLLMSPVGQKKASPILLGVDFGYNHYGVDKINSTGNTPGLKTSHNIYTWNGTARLMPKLYSETIIPFVDGMLGLKLFNSKTKIDKNLLNLALNDNQPEVINNVNDYGLNYGLGAGLLVNGSKPSYAGFSFRVLYFWGDNTTYVVRNSVKVDANRNVTFETGAAKTTMIVFQLGFTAANVRKMVRAPY